MWGARCLDHRDAWAWSADMLGSFIPSLVSCHNMARLQVFERPILLEGYQNRGYTRLAVCSSSRFEDLAKKGI